MESDRQASQQRNVNLNAGQSINVAGVVIGDNKYEFTFNITAPAGIDIFN